jgi:enoyl-CoA hydratase
VSSTPAKTNESTAARYEALAKDYTATAVSVEGAVLWITVGRSDTKHAIGDAYFLEMLELVETVHRDESIRVVVLTGENKRFSTGGDIRNMQQRQIDGTGISEKLTTSSSSDYSPRLYRSLLELGQPVIACVTGDAIGAGMTLALHCDIIFASRLARFGDTHVRLGLVAPGGYVWPQSVSVQIAKEYLLTGDLMSAEEAHRVGIVNRVYDDSELVQETAKLALRLAAGAPYAIRWTKRLLNSIALTHQDTVYQMGIAQELLTMTTEDHREAVAAFLERRAAEFRGR